MTTLPAQQHDEQPITLRNGLVELTVPCGFGPRISHFGFAGERNVFAEISPREQAVQTPYGDSWHIYGGHRLWYAPEHAERSYFPDNRPPRIERTPRGLRLTQDVETHSGIEKTLSVELATSSSHVVVSHQLRNCGEAAITLAPWALTAMAPGGCAFFPHPPFLPHPQALAPARALVLWPFTRMNDARFRWGERFVALQQDPTHSTPQKIGLYDPLGYMVYALGAQVFIKRHLPKPGPHADYGCNVQTFTNELFLELESLGPLVQLRPGQAVQHVEHWFLFRADTHGTDEAELERVLAPLLAQTESALA
jgi:hypothetical protein